ncbi:MAG: hypothetical protein ACI4RH_11990 [Huintestinicola sp.]
MRNNAKHVHNCLIPYEILSEEVKLKDLETIKFN